jgi:hypothetical protein
MRQTGNSTVCEIGVPPPDNFTYLLPVDAIEHAPDKPFCWDSTCLCHEDEREIGIVAQHVAQGLFTPEEATDFVGGKGI